MEKLKDPTFDLARLLKEQQVEKAERQENESKTAVPLTCAMRGLQNSRLCMSKAQKVAPHHPMLAICHTWQASSTGSAWIDMGGRIGTPLLAPN
jgi:hypothetical protein